MHKTEIYYFSGTGNSLQVARELQKGIPEARLIPMVSLLNRAVIRIEGETVGLVFPLHAFTVPMPVREFLKKLRPESASYLFAVATRGGSPCRVFQDVNRILKRKGKSLDAHFYINMPNNYLIGFDLPTPAHIARLESEMRQQVASIRKIITVQEKSREKDPHHHFLYERILFPLFKTFAHTTRYGNLERRFYADAKCTHCQTCERVCLSGKIKLRDGSPVWQKDIRCTFCFACINYCPAQAIQFGKSKTPEKGRYFHPEVTANDIAGQK